MMAVFQKGERIRHIGHLDIVRAMQRALRRSGLPVRYSQGFNPHILITFASALSTGACGEREIADITLNEKVTPEEFVTAMNQALPPQLRVLEARELDDRHPALMAMVRGAEYTLRIKDEKACEAMQKVLKDFLSQQKIITPRRTKSGMKDCDIRPLIHSLEFQGNEMKAVLTLTADASCKPDMLNTALSAFAGIETPRMLVIRDRLFGEAENGTFSPLEAL